MKAFLLQYWELLLLCCLCLFAILPLFSPGFFSMHDDEQIARVYELNNTLHAGNIPPRISQNLGFGYGYPFFNFYPSFIYYVAELFRLIGFSYIASVKLMIAAGFILAAFSMYFFAKEYFGRIGGVVSAVAYTYAPYHSVEVYVRGALPEFWAFVFIPLIFWCIEKIEKTQKTKYVLFASFSIAGLIVTHNLIAMMSGIFVGLFCLYLFIRTKNRKMFSFQVFLSGLWGLCLAAYFWIPSYFEKGATMVDLLTKEAGNYNQHFVYIRQFWNSPWGYGGSYPGPNDGLSFQIGQIHIGLVLLSLFFVPYFFYKNRKMCYVLILFLSLFMISLFIQTIHAKFIWDHIQLFWYMQFPWRFLVFSVFTTAVLSGSLFAIKMHTKKKLMLAAIMIGIVIVFNRGYFQPQKYYVHAIDTDYTALEKIRWDTSSLAFEYAPKGVKMKKNVFNNSVVAITKNEIAKSSYTIINGKMQVQVLTEKPQQKDFSADVVESGNFRINTFSFPGWKVFVDQEEVSYTDNNKLKLITIPLSQGKHTITAVFTDTIYRTIGNALSLISFVGAFVWTLSYSFHKKTKHIT